METTTLDISAAVIRRAEEVRDENEKIRARAKAEAERARRLIDEVATLIRARKVPGKLDQSAGP